MKEGYFQSLLSIPTKLAKPEKKENNIVSNQRPHGNYKIGSEIPNNYHPKNIKSSNPKRRMCLRKIKKKRRKPRSAKRQKPKLPYCSEIEIDTSIKPKTKPESRLEPQPESKLEPKSELPLCPDDTRIANIAEIGLRSSIIPNITCREAMPKPKPVTKSKPKPELPFCPEEKSTAEISRIGFSRKKKALPGITCRPRLGSKPLPMFSPGPKSVSSGFGFESNSMQNRESRPEPSQTNETKLPPCDERAIENGIPGLTCLEEKL